MPKSFSSANFSINEKEIICKLNLSQNPYAEEYQKDFSLELADQFENGSEEVPEDKWRANEYRLKGTKIVRKKEKRDASISPSSENKNTQISSDEENLKSPGSPILRTKNFFDAFRIFNDLRLKLSYANTTARFANKPFLPPVFGFAGLAYGIRLFVDMLIITVAIARPPVTLEDKKLSEWALIRRRFKNIIRKDNRISRMGNDTRWFAINLLAFWLSPPIMIALSITGLALDAMSAMINTFSQINTNKKLMNKLNKLAVNSNAEERMVVKDIKIKLSKKMYIDNFKFIHSLTATLLFSVGSILCLFPSTLLPGILLLGVGTLFTLPIDIKSLGGAAWRIGKNLGKSCKNIWDNYFTQQKILNPTQSLHKTSLNNTTNITISPAQEKVIPSQIQVSKPSLEVAPSINIPSIQNVSDAKILLKLKEPFKDEPNTHQDLSLKKAKNAAIFADIRKTDHFILKPNPNSYTHSYIRNSGLLKKKSLRPSQNSQCQTAPLPRRNKMLPAHEVQPKLSAAYFFAKPKIRSTEEKLINHGQEQEAKQALFSGKQVPSEFDQKMKLPAKQAVKSL